MGWEEGSVWRAGGGGINVHLLPRAPCIGFEIEMLGLVADSEHTILHSLSATKPKSLISKPIRVCPEARERGRSGETGHFRRKT